MHRSTLRLVAGTALAGAIVSLSPATATAGSLPGNFSQGQGESNVDQFHGEYDESVDFDVPEFHGIEPQLGLQYRSGRKNSFAGVGWALTGVSTIERTSQ